MSVPEYCPKCGYPRTNEGQPSARWFFACGSYGYLKDDFRMSDRSDLCCEREEAEKLRAEVARLREALEDIARHSGDCVKHDRTDHPLLGDVAAYGSIARCALKGETE